MHVSSLGWQLISAKPSNEPKLQWFNSQTAGKIQLSRNGMSLSKFPTPQRVIFLSNEIHHSLPANWAGQKVWGQNLYGITDITQSITGNHFHFALKLKGRQKNVTETQNLIRYPRTTWELNCINPIVWVKAAQNFIEHGESPTAPPLTRVPIKQSRWSKSRSSNNTFFHRIHRFS